MHGHSDPYASSGSRESPVVHARFLRAQSDEGLAAAAGEGNERAFEVLVLRYREPLLCYSRQLGLNGARSEDVAQQSLMRAWISLRGGLAVDNVRAWLYRIAHNATVDALRGPANAHEQLTDVAGELAAVNADPEGAVALRAVFADLAALPSMQREALLCTAVEGRSNEQAARALGVSHGAVRGLVYRARTAMRAAATALTPPSLLGWARGGGHRGTRLVDRLTSIEAGGAGAGVATGGLVKAGAMMLSAGAMVVGVAAVRHAPTDSAGGHHPSLGAANVAPRTRASRGLVAGTLPTVSRPGSRVRHTRGGTPNGSLGRLAPQTLAGPRPPSADARGITTSSVGADGNPAPSGTSPATGEGASAQAGEGAGAGSSSPVSTVRRISAPPVPGEGTHQAPGGGGTSVGSPNSVPVNPGGGELPGAGEGAGREGGSEHGTSGGGESLKKQEPSEGGETSVPPKKAAPPS
ncbi:MAG TPA: RNA polymerase sigma factor [Solirubrobacteraceae bacterium]|nr:RNA polymerase sigma factor [Solirubrobacteraceae bacterium]